MDVDKLRGELHGLMVLMASLSHGLEHVAGRGAKSVVYRAGRTIGLKAAGSAKTPDPIKAVALVQEELRRKGVGYQVDVWKPSAAAAAIYDKEDKKAMKLVFRNCMIRCALFRYSHEQQQSLCMMNQGEFCGIFQAITGHAANLEIVHAGENACLKELTWSSK